MELRHPFAWLPESKQKIVFGGFFLITMVVMVFLQIINAPLITPAAPQGIVSFEFAGDMSTAEAMIDSWGEKGRIAAALSLGLDYLFLLLYACSISLGCLLALRCFSSPFLIKIGLILSWSQLIAALLDSIENVALIQLLLGSSNPLWPAVSWWCAAPKFLLVVLGLAYVLIGGLVCLVRKGR